MQIKTRLTLLFTTLMAALLFAFALTVYFTSAETREDEYYKRLKQQAATKVSLLFDTKVAPAVLQLIYKKTPNALFQEEMAIYDTAFHLLYHDAVEMDKVKETRGMIDSIILLKEIKFYIKDLQVIGFLYKHDNTNYVITAAATDDYGLTKLVNLRNTLLIAFLIAIIIIFFTGRFLAQQSLKPVSMLVDKVKRITATNLDLRVNEGNRKDEIAALAITFNEMLGRLEQSFDTQKQFVSNISHELRTPLAAIVSELELSTNKERTNGEYKEVIRLALQDAKRLVRLSNGLLDLAKANYDQTAIAFKELRLDEILLDARQQVIKANPDYKVHIAFVDEKNEDDDYISINGNEYLLKVAFSNLMENGCKFSANKTATVTISHQHPFAVLKFADTGIGIPEEDLPKIFNSFYRGVNRHFADGNGIGLALTKRIITMHSGKLAVQTAVNAGTVFTLELPHV
jgi:signal transduction histidine kinase